ncbi:MAG: fatty acid kinase, partial [Solirubrobacteraceae bacterium]|nr:fatty acid kinase [Solirubrobacteraceae bacterium]
ARGNSGVILSQLIRGAAEELISRPGELVDPVLVGAAMARAAAQAYDSVRDPAEGTILTVVREMAGRIAGELAHMDEPRLGSDAPAARQDEVIAQVLEAAVRAGEDSVKRGPELLPVLREAGVVDAGGYGLVIVFSGIVAALRGSAPPPLEHHAAARVTHPQHESSTYRYCTNFAVTGSGLEPRRFTQALEELGDSVLVVGDVTTLKVHVHTDDPDAATGLFADAGEVSHLDVADMHEQVEHRAQRLAPDGNGGEPAADTCGALAVVGTQKMRRLFETLGVAGLEAGPTLNPSTYELLAGIHAVDAEQIVVLPNSSNVFMAADRAAELSDKEVRVVPTRSQQAGLAVAVALEPGRDAEENAAAMTAALDHVRTGGVARAAREDAQGRFGEGDAVGFVGDEIVAWGDPPATLRSVLAGLGDGAEIVTCVSGDGAPLPDEEVLALAPAGVDVECSEGGQANWWWLLAAE